MEEQIFFNNSKNYFTYYAKDNIRRNLIVIVPGGGYNHTSKFEAENVSRFFLDLGLHTVVLNYRESLDIYPNPQSELAYVNDYFRSNSTKYNIGEKILNIGFSAGGHLCLSQAIYNELFGKKSMPDGLILCYPVVSSNKEIYHKGSFECLLEDKISKELLEKLSLEKHIDKLCDVFIWTTFTDNAVNPLNSIYLVEELYKHNINTEFHMYSKGEHGMSLADSSMTNGKEDMYINSWTKLVKNWLSLKKFI